jgi:hypothetical protein
MNTGIFLCGVGIQITSNQFKAVKDLVRISFFSLFKKQVLYEMCEPIFGRIFITGARIDNNTGMRNIRRAWFMQNTYSVLQLVYLVIHLAKV